MTSTPESRALRVRTSHISAIEDEVVARLQCDQPREMVNRLDALWAEQMADAEDHVLRLAGRLCMEFGQRDLWEQLFRETRDGCQVDPGDEMAFLLGRPLNAESGR